MNNPYTDQATQRSNALCMETPTKGENMVPLPTESLGVLGGRAVETKVCLYSRSSRARMAEVDPMRTGLGQVSLPIEMTRPALYSRCASVKSSIPIPCEGPDAARV